jgi:hypothetical protein
MQPGLMSMQVRGVACDLGAHIAGIAVATLVVAGVYSLVMESLRIRTKNRFPLSPLAIGIGWLSHPTAR